MLFGVDINSKLFLDILKIDKESIPRFRNCFLSERDGELTIVIHTRTGGGNREYYDEPNVENNEGPWNSDLRKNPNYLYDEDDAFDSTYADFYFSIPSEVKEKLQEIHKESPALTPSEQWKILFEALEKR